MDRQDHVLSQADALTKNSTGEASPLQGAGSWGLYSYVALTNVIVGIC